MPLVGCIITLITELLSGSSKAVVDSRFSGRGKLGVKDFKNKGKLYEKITLYYRKLKK